VFSVVDLGATSQMLMDAALKNNTKRTYNSAQNKYVSFCNLYKLAIMPASEETLLLYVSFLFEQGLTGASIRVYLSAVRSLHIFADKQYPTDLNRVKLALKGAVRRTPKPIQKLPITIQILRDLLSKLKDRFDESVMRAVMTLAFFGCFRLGELCPPDGESFSPTTHLCVSDITLNESDLVLSVFLKRSKTDTHNLGVPVYIGCSKDPLCCAFCAMKQYLLFRDSLQISDPYSPLFLVPGGTILTKTYMISVTRILLSITGNDPSLYSGHSYRAGAATTAGNSKFREWELKMLGRWASTAYNLYLRNPKLTASFAQRLAAMD
jgi:hypothetical protein